MLRPYLFGRPAPGMSPGARLASRHQNRYEIPAWNRRGRIGRAKK